MQIYKTLLVGRKQVDQQVKNILNEICYSCRLRHSYQFNSNAIANSMNLRYLLICLNPGKIFEFRELNRTTRALNNKRNNYDLMLCRF